MAVMCLRMTGSHYSNGERITKPTRQVEIILKGNSHTHLDLGNCIGQFTTRKYQPEPTRCFNCQAFGHLARECRSPARCAICALPHDTRQCPEKTKDKMSYKCANCKGQHSAANNRCPRRKEILEKMQKKNNSSQPASTDQQTRPRLPALASNHFPALPVQATTAATNAVPNPAPPSE